MSEKLTEADIERLKSFGVSYPWDPRDVLGLIDEVGRLRQIVKDLDTPCCATDHARVCDKPGCHAATIRRECGRRECAAGHPTRWCEVSERDALLGEVQLLNSALRALHDERPPRTQ